MFSNVKFLFSLSTLAYCCLHLFHLSRRSFKKKKKKKVVTLTTGILSRAVRRELARALYCWPTRSDHGPAGDVCVTSATSGPLPYIFMPGKMAAIQTRCYCQWT